MNPRAEDPRAVDPAAPSPSAFHVLTPRLVLGAVLLAIGAVGTAVTLDIVPADAADFVAWPIGLSVIGLLQVALGDRPLAKVVGLCLACLGGATVLGSLFLANPYDVPAELDLVHVVLSAAVLLLGGFVLTRAYGRATGRESSRGRVRIFNVWSGRETEFAGDDFAGGDVTAIMGGFELDLRRASIPPGGTAVLDVLAIMGGGSLRIPEHWEVDDHVTPIMGGVSIKAATVDDGSHALRGTRASSRLRLEGLAIMGGLDVKRG